jgi:hypothetical protein
MATALRGHANGNCEFTMPTQGRGHGCPRETATDFWNAHA